MKVFVCRELGGLCNWRGSASTEEELMKKIARHGALKHNMNGMSETMQSKIIDIIRERQPKQDNIP